MNETAVIAPVRKTVHVKVPIAHAFEVFTSGLTRWWPHDHGVGKKPIQKVLMNRGSAGAGSRYRRMAPKLRSPRSRCGSRRIASCCYGRSTPNGSRMRP